jgi:hypothetical protein
MPRIQIPANNRGLISTFGQYSNRNSTSFSGILGTATYPQRSLSNLNIGNYGSGNFLFWLNIANSNASRGFVIITSPWVEQSSGTELIGNNRQVFTGTQPNISISCNVNYGFSFRGWFTLPSGGTLISSSPSNTVRFDHPNFNNVWYAQYN